MMARRPRPSAFRVSRPRASHAPPTSETLKAISAELSYQNLDALEMFKGINTTTEFLARHVFDRMRTAIKDGTLGPGADGVTAMKVTLWESHIAWAAYEEAV